MLVRLVPALSNRPWNHERERSRAGADVMCESFSRSSQTMSVGRFARRRRPRMRWPVPKASMVALLGSVMRLERKRTLAEPGAHERTAAGYD